MYGAHKSEIEAEWESKWSFYAFIYWKFTTSLYNLINAFNSTQTMKNHNNDWSKKNLIYNAMPFFFEHFNSNFQQNKKTWFNWNSSFNEFSHHIFKWITSHFFFKQVRCSLSGNRTFFSTFNSEILAPLCMIHWVPGIVSRFLPRPLFNTLFVWHYPEVPKEFTLFLSPSISQLIPTIFL